MDNSLEYYSDDEDLDFAIAASLHHYEKEAVESSASHVCRKDEKESEALSDDDDLDFAIASSLQSQLESKSDSESLANQVNSKDDEYFTKLDDDLDYALALSLQSTYNDEIKSNSSIEAIKFGESSHSKPLSIVDKNWELIDPNPDIHALFQEYNKRFFYGALGSVSVSWSRRMTLCAGVCSYEGRGGLCSVRLSMPLLKLRPRKDLVETLLHEMIHAYLFVTHNWRDRSDHGPKFLGHMHRINKESGSNITVYHSFHDEVDHYRKHVWQCDGPCRLRPPYFGQLKRVMNRAPGPRDPWWAEHQSRCGGKYVKIKEPDKKNNGNSNRKGIKRKPPSDSANSNSGSDIRSFLNNEGSKPSPSKKNLPQPVVASSSNIATVKSFSGENSKDVMNSAKVQSKTNFVPFRGTGFKLGSGPSEQFDAHPLVSLISGFRKNNSSSILKENKGRTNSENTKFPRNSSFQDAKSAVKGSLSSNSLASNSTPKKLIQSPMDKYLSPEQSIKNTKLKEESNREMSIKIACPVCFLQFTESEIYSHIDKCLEK